MFDVAWPELVVVGVVTLVAIGPKDLPKVMAALGRWARQSRAIMQDVRRVFDQLTYEAELDEITKHQTKPPSPPTLHDVT